MISNSNCCYAWWKFNLDTYNYISSENQWINMYIIHKWSQNLKKMGFGYQRFHPKIDPNIGFIVFKRTGFATRFQQSNRWIHLSSWGWDILWEVPNIDGLVWMGYLTHVSEDISAPHQFTDCCVGTVCQSRFFWIQ